MATDCLKTQQMFTRFCSRTRRYESIYHFFFSVTIFTAVLFNRWEEAYYTESNALCNSIDRCY